MRKKLLAAFVAVTMALSLCSCGAKPAASSTATASSAAASETSQTETIELQVLATSDQHGKFYTWDYALNEESTSGSMLQQYTAIKELRNENTLLLDAGDTIQDNSADLFLEDDIHPMLAAMNYMGYDAWTLGNHEFNYGMSVIKKIIATSNAAVLCGNVLDENGEPLAAGYTIVEKAGLKIGIIGVVTPNITRWDSVNLAKCTVTDPVVETRKIIDAIKDECDVLIALDHMGVENEYEVSNSGVTDLANACPELDLIIASHEHSAIEGKEINGVLIVENKSQCQTMSQVILTVAKGENGAEVVGRESKLLTMKEYAPDTELADVLASYNQTAVDNAVVVIGKLEGGDLAPQNEIAAIPTAQIQDTALIDLINEVQLYYTGAKVSAAALFTSTANLKVGEIRRCDTSLIYKYTNTLYKLEMTGSQLKKFMEWSVKYFNQYQDGDLTVSFNPDVRAYNYDMFAGVTYDIDITQPAGSRIKNLCWPDGTPVADDEVFTIAVNNYRANSHLLSAGEIYTEDDMPKLLEIDVRGEIGGVRELIGNYITEVKGGVITPNVDNNWKIVGNDWDPALHAKAVEQVAAGLISIPTSEDGRTPNVKSITVSDLK